MLDEDTEGGTGKEGDDGIKERKQNKLQKIEVTGSRYDAGSRGVTSPKNICGPLLDRNAPDPVPKSFLFRLSWLHYV